MRRSRVVGAPGLVSRVKILIGLLPLKAGHGEDTLNPTRYLPVKATEKENPKMKAEKKIVVATPRFQNYK